VSNSNVVDFKKAASDILRRRIAKAVTKAEFFSKDLVDPNQTTGVSWDDNLTEDMLSGAAEMLAEMTILSARGSTKPPTADEGWPEIVQLHDMTREQHVKFAEWRDSRPELIQDMIRDYPMWDNYFLNGKRCQIEAYNEDGTLRVLTKSMMGQFYHVFGVKPGDLSRET
jgi:hypothetical protein